MPDLKAYKCPCCGGNIEFDTSIQKCKCPFCDTEFEMEALLAYDEDLNNDGQDETNWNMGDKQEWTLDEESGLRSYVCKSCGGEIIAEETTGATACPYCGNPVVMMEQFKGLLKPDYVIPFKLDKNAAKAKLLEHYKGKKLLPKAFRSENHLDEIKGVYVPFWLFNADASGTVRYKGTKVRCWSSGKYDYTETSYYSIVRGGNVKFEHIPIDGSEKMPDDLMESIEPFDFNEAVDFQTAYLSGFLADKYDVSDEETVKRANERAKKSLEEIFRNSATGYTTIMSESSSIKVDGGEAIYALFPVWVLNTTYNGQKYTFAMNGQTGKFVGDLPMDKGLRNKYFAISFAIAGAVAAALTYVWWLL
ncbi:MAG: hypothetical protein IJK13_01690 [Lachnospiraceae bacterium]|jgi:DNA-directed RNA polymerase subunit RPC12/RpoP|nr:hypothetical protein [Lachnospiraceae bacterium]MBQ9579622.1 hypothetical protein [Lachnospiraceae bacterium]MBR0434701.1 hypothetical protein [Lachnospiraceae bacterium]